VGGVDIGSRYVLGSSLILVLSWRALSGSFYEWEERIKTYFPRSGSGRCYDRRTTVRGIILLMTMPDFLYTRMVVCD